MPHASLLAILLISAGSAQSADKAPRYDLVLRGGKVVDGTGNPWFHGDVAIDKDRIVAVVVPCRPGRAAASSMPADSSSLRDSSTSTATPSIRSSKMAGPTARSGKASPPKSSGKAIRPAPTSAS